MKTPEEIKKGLECCNSTANCESECPYHVTLKGSFGCDESGCDDSLLPDALAYIKLLEDGIEQWEYVAASPGAVEDMARENAQMQAEIDRQREKIRVLELSLQAVNDGNAALQRENLMLESRLPRWISVKDRLPERHGQMCVCLYNQHGADKSILFPYVFTWHAYGDNGYVNGPHFSDEGLDGLKVWYWMPLPEPPKEE